MQLCASGGIGMGGMRQRWCANATVTQALQQGIATPVGEMGVDQQQIEAVLGAGVFGIGHATGKLHRCRQSDCGIVQEAGTDRVVLYDK
jgi:hypothetical protein